MRIWLQAFPHLRIYQICGDDDVTFDGEMSVINTAHIKTYLNVAINDWLKRRDFNSSLSHDNHFKEMFSNNEDVNAYDLKNITNFLSIYPGIIFATILTCVIVLICAIIKKIMKN